MQTRLHPSVCVCVCVCVCRLCVCVCVICVCDITHSYVQYVSFVRGTWLIYTFDLTQSTVWRDPIKCMQTHCNTLQHTATHWNTLQLTATHHNTLQRVWHDLIKYVQTQIHLSASIPPIWVYHSHLLHDSLIRATWLIYTYMQVYIYMYMNISPLPAKDTVAFHIIWCICLTTFKMMCLKKIRFKFRCAYLLIYMYIWK